VQLRQRHRWLAAHLAPPSSPGRRGRLNRSLSVVVRRTLGIGRCTLLLTASTEEGRGWLGQRRGAANIGRGRSSTCFVPTILTLGRSACIAIFSASSDHPVPLRDRRRQNLCPLCESWARLLKIRQYALLITLLPCYVLHDFFLYIQRKSRLELQTSDLWVPRLRRDHVSRTLS
jgi:hypothetical protein